MKHILCFGTMALMVNAAVLIIGTNSYGSFGRDRQVTDIQFIGSSNNDDSMDNLCFEREVL